MPRTCNRTLKPFTNCPGCGIVHNINYVDIPQVVYYLMCNETKKEVILMNMFKKKQFDILQTKIKKVLNKLDHLNSDIGQAIPDLKRVWENELEPLLKERDKYIK
ncbi:hypothetical protein LCGC14_0992260 [marine sediment metagenome]|uniref:Uncharacterized protein n=1 Tax=marine sediment metagenome TaxID=412755 RepID=A0A0F9NS09_9ZZZZ